MKTQTELEDLRLLRIHSAKISKRQAKNHLNRIAKRARAGKIQL